MEKVAESAGLKKGEGEPKRAVSELGKKLRAIREEMITSGEPMLTTREQLEQEISDRRTGNF